jgi:FSR family fosmidomycin resistance protein-like MFS transporter
MSKTFQKKKIFSISIAHFFHDIYPAIFAPMIPLLMAQFGLTLSAAGLLDIARRIPSLATPLVGIIADKAPVKYFIILTPGITAVSMCLIGVVPSYWMLFLLLFTAGLSSVCFHVPSPVLIKSFSGKQIGKGMSYYMSFGAMAGTAGTFAITLLITTLGLEKSYLLMFFGIATSIVLYFRLKDVEDVHISKKHDENIKYKPIRHFIPFFLVLALIMLFRAGMSLALTLYLPVYLTESGISLWFAGVSLSVLYLAGSAGMILFGHISDKFSKRKLLFLLTLCSVCAMWGLIYFRTDKILIPVFLIILGVLLFASAPIILALVQGLHTKRPAFINSIYFTLGFVINVTGVLAVGFSGDKFGLEKTFEVCATLPLLSLLFLPFLPHHCDEEER